MILVVIPYWRSKETLQESVDSILHQSYHDYEIIIVNDGDQESPRDFILPHKRLRFFDLSENRGRYFIDAMCVMANPHEYYLPHDSDDISSYDRLFHLMRARIKSGADVIYHAQKVITRTGRKYIESYPLLKQPQSHIMRHLAHHSGLYTTNTLRSIGSYHPDFRIGYDTLLVNLIKMKYKIAMSPRVLYTRIIRDNSLTTAVDTGFNSVHRRQTIADLQRLYRKCYEDPANIKHIIEKSIKPDTIKTLKRESNRLKQEMGWS